MLMKYLVYIFYRVYIPLFAEKNSVVWVDPYREWYALYYSDIKKWEFKKGDYLK